MMRNMMNHDFEETRTKKIVLDQYSPVAVQEFVKFLYGLELNLVDLKKDLLIVKDLLIMGSLYDVELLQKAAASFIEEQLTKENVTSTMKFAKTYNAKDTVKLCVDFILKNERLEIVINDTELLCEFPELAVEVLQRKRKELCNIETKKIVSRGKMMLQDLKIFKYDRTKPIFTGIKIGFDLERRHEEEEMREMLERVFKREMLERVFNGLERSDSGSVCVVADKRPIIVRGIELVIFYYLLSWDLKPVSILR